MCLNHTVSAYPSRVVSCAGTTPCFDSFACRKQVISTIKDPRMKKLFALSLLALLSIGQSVAASTFHFDSPPGDYVGGGQSLTYTDATHAFDISAATDSRVSIYIHTTENYSDYWHI